MFDLERAVSNSCCRYNIFFCNGHGGRYNSFVVLEQWIDSSEMSGFIWVKVPFLRSSFINDTVSFTVCCYWIFRLVWISLVALLVGKPAGFVFGYYVMRLAPAASMWMIGSSTLRIRRMPACYESGFQLLPSQLVSFCLRTQALYLHV
jgi:hypothetical protein